MSETLKRVVALMEEAATLGADSADFFTAAALAELPLEERKSQALGMALSSWTHYNGDALLEIAANALEDANWSDECALLRAVLEMDEAQVAQLVRAAVPAPAVVNCENGDCPDHYGDPTAWCPDCRLVAALAATEETDD